MLISRFVSRTMYSNMRLNRIISRFTEFHKGLWRSHFVQISSSSRRCCRTSNSDVMATSEEKTEDEFILNDQYYKEIVNDIYRHFKYGHKLLVIQPRLKITQKWERKSVAEMKLAEAVALAETLADWKVVEKHVIPVLSLEKTLLFGKGNLEKIKLMIYESQCVTGIFFGVDMLSSLQAVKLEEHFGIPVFDRYRIILQIFHDHARTKEAKLQVALAEIPYLRVKLCGFSHTFNYQLLGNIHSVGGTGETSVETRRQLLHERELRLKKSVQKLKKQRLFLNQSEKRRSYPIIAVVGYTNSGKTTLIKALTDDKKLKPENKLFATLDVTLHSGILPTFQKVLYVDTVGFISDVPTTLVESFKSTLEDISLADVIIHVRDISHPNTETQKTVVLETLKKIALPHSLLESIIEVGNKVDLLERYAETNEGTMLISATEGTGLSQLATCVQNHIMKAKGQCIKIFRVPNGGIEYSWLLKEAAVTQAFADDNDPNYLLVEVIISSSTMSRFIHKYGDLSSESHKK